MSKAIRFVFLLTVVGALAQALWYHQHLPERVASHFDAQGNANGWTTRNQNLVTQCGLILFVAGMMQGLAWGLPRMPAHLINLPHRDYWLAPARRAATFEWLGAMLQAMGCVLLGFFIVLFHATWRANQTDGQRLEFSLAGTLGAMTLVTVCVVGSMLRRFRKPRATD